MTCARLVGILCGCSPAERSSTLRGRMPSVTAVADAPLIIAAGPDSDHDARTVPVDQCAAVVASGGGDVDRELNGDDGSCGPADEIALVQRARAQRKRELGVRRGHRLLAVIDGGTQVGDLAKVRVEPGSVAAQVPGDGRRVNSINHQAVADPRPTLRATARNDDGVIESVEGPGLLGVQWHPERLSASDPRFFEPFRWLVGG